jgi:tetratricopeptide (TPR) repeat protein/transcriptional regulator with XRE-family HTH domain
MAEGVTSRRYCRCGTRLARDNAGSQCAACMRRARDLVAAAPEVPAAFWQTDQLRDALEAWHMGRVITAYRTHPFHTPPLSQEIVAGWMGLTQAQLSRIEGGEPIMDLARLIRWAKVLRLPEELLWFRLPGGRRHQPATAARAHHLPAPRRAPAVPAADIATDLHTFLSGLHLPQEVVATLHRGLDDRPPGVTDAVAVASESEPAFDDLVQLLQAWASTVIRREFLLTAGRAAAVAAALPALGEADPNRLTAAASGVVRVDAQTIDHLEVVLRHIMGQDAALGPQAVLGTVLDQRHLTRQLLDNCPAPLRSRLLAVYAGLCRATGWFLFDLGHYDLAVPHFEQARSAAHEARNTELGALVLCNLAQTAIWQDRPRLAVDHAVAAVAWAHRTPDHRLQANAGDMAARAYAAAGDYDAAMAGLHQAETALSAVRGEPSVVDWYDDAFLTGIRGQCLLTLHRPDEAVAIIAPAAASLDEGVSVRNLAMTTVDLATAYTEQGEVEAAARALTRAGQLAARNRSVRLAARWGSARRGLEPWADAPAVRELDEQLGTLRRTGTDKV